MRKRKRVYLIALAAQMGFIAAPALAAPNTPTDGGQAKAEHDTIGAGESKNAGQEHTQHPDAQWYGDAALGLFIHWGISSVRSMNISWPMIPGRVLAKQKLSADELQRVIRECDWNLTGKPNEITPNEYFALAKDFNPTDFQPEHWVKAAKDAGFSYTVLTARHHEGFSLWPSAFDPDFNTKTWMGGRDLIKEYVDACHKYGMKVGIYYSPPNWHFDRDYMSFVYGGAYKMNPDLPKVGPDLKPRTTQHTEEETKQHQAEYAALVKGQVEELLTRYGKIDLMWFDGSPPIPNRNSVITRERIHELQPGIVINPRLHGTGDFKTYERNLPKTKPAPGWQEFCDPWTGVWSHSNKPFRSNGFVIGELAQCRAWGINFLPGIGPMASGEFSDGVYRNMAVVGEWMKVHSASVKGVKPLVEGETASVPATAAGATRYLFAIPKYEGGLQDENQVSAVDETITIKGVTQPTSVKLMGDGQTLESSFADGTMTVKLPANRRTKLVDVIAMELGK